MMILNDEKFRLTEIAQGSETSFSYIYELYFPQIRRYVIKFVKSEEQADDLCQEIFLKVWDNRENLLSVVSFKAYLFVLARNHCFNFLKHAAVERALQDEITRSVLDLKNQTEDDLQTREYLQYIETVLTQIPERSRQIFELCRDNETSYNDAAKQLGISSSAVKKHMVRTMKHLKFSIRSEFGFSVSWAFVVSYISAI